MLCGARTSISILGQEGSEVSSCMRIGTRGLLPSTSASLSIASVSHSFCIDLSLSNHSTISTPIDLTISSDLFIILLGLCRSLGLNKQIAWLVGPRYANTVSNAIQIQANPRRGGISTIESFCPSRCLPFRLTRNIRSSSRLACLGFGSGWRASGVRQVSVGVRNIEKEERDADELAGE